VDKGLFVLCSVVCATVSLFLDNPEPKSSTTCKVVLTSKTQQQQQQQQLAKASKQRQGRMMQVVFFWSFVGEVKKGSKKVRMCLFPAIGLAENRGVFACHELQTFRLAS
jgi:hypothetical protein